MALFHLQPWVLLEHQLPTDTCRVKMAFEELCWGGHTVEALRTVLAHLRQRGIRAPDSWLNFRCTLSSCRVRISSWGITAEELSLPKLSLRLL